MTSQTTTHASSNALTGILLILAATLVFAMGDTISKYLVTKYNVPFMAAIRYAVNLALLGAIFGPPQGKTMVTVTRKWVVLVRAASLAMGTLFMSSALQVMPVGETVAIIYLAPLVVTVLAGPLLAEKVSPFAWIAAALGFAGVLVIMRPGSGLSATGIVYALIAAATSVVYHMLSRVLSKTESTLTLLFYTTAFGAVFFCAMLPWFWTQPATWKDTGLFIAMGFVGLAGHYFFTSAYRYAQASVLGPVNYVHLVWAVLLGWLVYDHIPDHWSMLGMAMIILAGVSVALRTHLARDPRPMKPEEA